MQFTISLARTGAHWRRHWRIMRCSVLGIALIAGLVAAQEFEISRWTVDGGGVVQSQGGNFELSGTMGQPDAGIMSGGNFELTGGFWFEIPPADCDDDGSVGLLDAQDFVSCMSGPTPLQTLACRCFDIDQNGTVDLADFSSMQAGFQGD